MSNKYGHETEETDDSGQFNRDLSQLARLAVLGKHQDAVIFIKRLARRYRHVAPDLAQQLVAALNQADQRPHILRGGPVEAMPVDLDSRLSLARIEDPVQIALDPMWADDVQRALEQIVSERRMEAALFEAALHPTRTALFTGPPGVGKTLAARWIAKQLNRPLITLDLAAIMSSFLGRTGGNVKNILDYAKGVDCVFLLDEFDAMAKRRDDAVEIGELKRLVTVLLQEIDQWPPSGLLIAATNHEDLLDPAVWRRFEIVVSFPMPRGAEVRRTVELCLQGTDVGSRWIPLLARVLEGWSYAEIERGLTKARREAIVHSVPIDQRLQTVIHDRAQSLRSVERRKLAIELLRFGLSQRDVQTYTGVSRDTIRKYQEGRA